IGRASRGEKGEISGGAGLFKKKKNYNGNVSALRLDIEHAHPAEVAHECGPARVCWWLSWRLRRVRGGRASLFSFFFQAEDGIRDWSVTGVQTCALPISRRPYWPPASDRANPPIFPLRS